MKKKTEAIAILENGGYILVDSIYRTARIYIDDSDRDGDSIRYDVAERLEKTPGYKKRFSRGWCMSWYIEKEKTEEEKAAAEWAAESDDVQAATLAALAPVIAAEETAAAAPEAETETEAEERAPEYLNEKWPASNSAPGISYIIKYRVKDGGLLHRTFETVEDLQSAIQQIKYNGGYIVEAARIDKNAVNMRDYIREFIPETRQEQTDRENREQCKRIAEDIEAYADGRVYRCPDCGAVHEWDSIEETEHDDENGWTVYSCPDCGAEAAENEWEQLNLYDYFSDCFDIEYRCGSDKEYRSCSVMVACGGPNIYIDTARRAVLLYWWTDRAEYPLLSDAVDAVDEWAEEYWDCL